MDRKRIAYYIQLEIKPENVTSIQRWKQIVLKISSGSRRSWPLFNRTDSLKQPYIPLVKYIVISDMDAQLSHFIEFVI